MTDEAYTTRDLDHYFEDFTGTLKEIKKDVKEIKEQTQKTNGRVTKLEAIVKDYPSIRSKVLWIIGVGSAFVFFSATLGYFIYHDIDSKINTGIQQAFNDRFSKIEVVQ